MEIWSEFIGRSESITAATPIAGAATTYAYAPLYCFSLSLGMVR